MRTVNPSIVIGNYTWDQDQVPRDEFQIRMDALNRVMDEKGLKAMLVYGDMTEHSALAYFSNFTPRLRWGMALFPRNGEPRLLVSMSPRDIPAMRLMTWIADVHSGWNWQSVFDPWLAKLDAEGAADIGTVGFDMMRPPLFESLQKSLGNRFGLQEADAPVAACRVPRPRASSLMRGACAVATITAEAFLTAWRSGRGAEAAALEAERTARLKAAQDVRTLVSLDGGRTLVPFRGSFDSKTPALAGYIAVKHMGYWADVLVSEGCAPDLQQRADAARSILLQAVGPGVTGATLHAKATAALKPYGLHPVLSRSVGNRIGLSDNEGGALTADSQDTLIPGDTYTLQVGAHDATGGAFASAIVAVTPKGCELLLRSPAPAIS
jgi:Xaa-Pro aminopeptidase